MDPRLLRYYENELRHVREMGSEFAEEFPKIAGRLGLDGFACADPYVERLFEGFAFMAARVQLKMDAEFPQLVQHLLEMVYPHLLAPLPSMAVVQLQPDMSSGSVNDGFRVPRHTTLRSLIGPNEQTACQYRTAHDVTLWPVEVSDVNYFSRDTASIELPENLRDTEAGLRVRLRVAPGKKLSKLPIDRLPFYLRGREDLPVRLYEQCFANLVGVLVRPVGQGPARWQKVMGPQQVQRVGFDEDQSLLPYSLASFQGYRLLREYFAFHHRFLFVELTDLRQYFQHCTEDEIEFIFLFNRADSDLSRVVDKRYVALYCAPAINLYPLRADAVHIDNRQSEHHIVPDRTRPMDLEVYQLNRVVGMGVNADQQQEFLPFYALHDQSGAGARAYYAQRRMPRVLTSKQRQHGLRTNYVGSELFVSLVDAEQAPYQGDIQILTAEVLCTNRDLPLQMPVGIGETDFTLEIGAPVTSIRCVTGPTAPRPSLAHVSGDMTWKLISHLSLNYLSITDNDQHTGAAALRELLSLYCNSGVPAIEKQIEGIRHVQSQPIIRPLPTTGPLTFGRGLEVSVTADEEAFEGVGVYLLGAVLEEFFARYVSINSFTETVLRTQQRHEVARWPMRYGKRQIL